MNSSLLRLLQDSLTPEQQLYEAVSNNKTQRLQDLIQKGTDVNSVVLKQGGFTALHIAAQHGLVECIKILLNAGADPSIQNDFNNTPIIYAAKNGQIMCMKILLSSNPHPIDIDNIWSSRDGSRLIWGDANDDVICVLLKATPNLNAVCSNVQKNLLHSCIAHQLSVSLKMWFFTGNSVGEINDTAGYVFEDEFVNWLKQYKTSVHSLQHYCRLAIRRSFHKNCNVFWGSKTLLLPPLLRYYLVYSNT